MDDYFEDRDYTDIDDKLMHDNEKLFELRDSLDRSEQMTREMTSILDSFTSRLKRLDETILPVYDQTLRLTRLQENVKDTLLELDRVISFYHVSDDVDAKIREGPGGDIKSYLELLDKLKDASKFFRLNNPESMELVRINELLETGLDALAREFLQCLKKHSKPVHTATLHDIAACEDTEDLPSVDLLAPKVISDLRDVAAYYYDSPGENHSDIMSMYCQIRSNQLGRALRSLKEDNQNQSLLAPNMPKKSAFGGLLKHGQTPVKKASRRGQQFTASGIHAVPSASVEPSTSAGSMVEEQLDGCSAFIMSSTVFLRLIQSESRLMAQIIPQPFHSHALDHLTKQPIDYFMKDGETLFQQARRSISHGEYSVIISCLRLIRHVHSLLPEYKAELLPLESHPYDRFPRLLQQFERLCAKALLDDYILSIQADSEKSSNLPKDGTVHALTSSTLSFMEQLLDYSRIVGEVLQGQSSFAVSSTEAERNRALGKFLTDVLNALNMNMENKARNYETPSLAAIFLLNNFHFIHKTFTNNTLMLGLLQGTYADIQSHFEGNIQEKIHAYQRSFSKLLSHMGQEVSLNNLTPADKLNNQRRQLLKDKFKGINTELEELKRVQEQWSIPDSQLRARIRSDNVGMILPIYEGIYEPYSTLQFTKNPEKYLKYNPEQLEKCLRSFFDGGAT